jgi:hypothetical protein
MRLVKSLLVLSILCLFASNAFAVAGYRYWINGGVDSKWSTSGNWSLTSGGTGTGPVPTNADTCVFDVNGNVDMTADAGSLICYALRVTSGYTHKFTFTVNIDVQQELTLGANMTFTASTTKGFRQTSTPATWTSNGVTFTGLITFNNAATVTLGDNWTASGGITVSSATVLNSNTFNISGGTLTVSAALSGTTALVFGTTGSMTWAGTSSIANNLTINTSGTLTLASGVTIAYKTGTLTYTAGTIVNTNNTLSIPGSATLNTNGMSWNNVTVASGNAGTCTLNSLLTISSTLTATNEVYTFAGSGGWTCAIFSNTANALNITLHSGNTYTITTTFTSAGGTIVNPSSYIASTVNGTKASLNYTGAASGLNCIYNNFTDIDASGGNTIWVYVATLTRTVNINSRAAGSYVPVTVASTSGW